MVKVAYSLQPCSNTFTLLANGKDVLTPKGNAYALPNQTVAAAVLAEWQAQGKKIDPAMMPLTQFAATALDLIAPDTDAALARILSQLDHDMLCQRASQPEKLKLKQQEIWQPYLDWCEQKVAVKLVTGDGLHPVAQSAAAHQAIRRALIRYDAWQLAGLSEVMSLTNSVVLGLALSENYQSAQKIFLAAELEALFQAEQWGLDPLAKVRHDGIRRDLANCERWLRINDQTSDHRGWR